MKKILVAFVLAPLYVFSYETCITNGYKFSYVVSNGKATYTSDAKNLEYSGNLTIPAVINGYPVRCIGSDSFNMIKNLKDVVIEDGIEEIGHAAFYADGTGPTSVTIPPSVTKISGTYTFRTMPRIYWTVSGADLEISNGAFCIFRSGEIHVTALAGVPKNMPKVGITGYLEANPNFRCRREHLGEWLSYYNNDYSRFNSIYDDGCSVEVISSKIRENDPTILDVVYKVKSNKSKVKVRVLAFEDGERSIAKLVRPVTFVDGTDVNVGDDILPNVEHTVSWRVSSDWTTKLAKVKFEVLAMEGALVPLELMTIPASDQYGKMKISWNALWDNQLFEALLWLVASSDTSLSFSSGILSANGTNIAQNTGFANNTQREFAATYIFGKMGYQRLTGAHLNYANQETRLGLTPNGSRQYVYKIVP
jgi:hypothetical protein